MKLKVLPKNAYPIQPFSTWAAGIDIATNESKELYPDEVHLFKTGLKIAIPGGYFGLLASRSGLGIKRGLVIAQGIGVIDADYRGELMIPIRNVSDEDQYINSGDRIAQLIIIPHAVPDLVVVDSLEETKRGEGGFGSTGT